MSDDDIEIIYSSQINAANTQKTQIEWQALCRQLKQDMKKLQEQASQLKYENAQSKSIVEQYQLQILELQSQIMKLNEKIEIQDSQITNYMEMVDDLHRKNEVQQDKFEQIKDKLDSITNSQICKDNLLQSVTMDTQRLSSILKSQSRDKQQDKSQGSSQYKLCSFGEVQNLFDKQLFSEPSSIVQAVRSIKEQSGNIEDKGSIQELMQSIEAFQDNLKAYHTLNERQFAEIGVLKEELGTKHKTVESLPLEGLQRQPSDNDFQSMQQMPSLELETSQYEQEQNQTTILNQLESIVHSSTNEERIEIKQRLEQLIVGIQLQNSADQ